MSLHPELSYDREVDCVRGVQFSVLSPEEIQARSVCHVTATEMYNHAGEPIPGGLFDARMGVIDHTRLCRTCEQRNTMCPGHFGHIELARPVFHVHFFEIVRKLLKCVCFRCSRLLVDVERPDVKAFLSKKHSRQKRWEFMHRMNSQKVGRCGAQTLDGCGALQPSKIQREGIYKVVFEWKDTSAASSSSAAAAAAEDDEDDADGQQQSGGAAASTVRRLVLSAEDVLRILRRITDADAEVLGFHPRYCRPEWLVCTTLPVPPPAVRPSVRNDGGQRCEDDLTHCLLHIVKTNNTLQQRIDKGVNPEHIEVMVSLLQSFVAALVDNGGTTGLLQMKQRTGRPLRAVTDRLKGKEGRIRGNLMGKRVDFSARSVITPDPNISIDELGVPVRVAMNLTFPEVVNAGNRERLLALVEAGPEAYPGARYVRKTATDGRVLVLKKIVARAAIELQDGDVVDRHLRDGDVVLFNRQPSLHKMSMMAHRVRVMPYNTFRLNVCVCPVFNSDFDGDEMNMHVPQSAQTHEELRQLAAVSKHILTPRMSKPLISVVQDITLGVYKISQPDVAIPEKAFFNMLAANPDARLPPAGRGAGGAGAGAGAGAGWTGRHALTSILPANVNVRMRNGLYDEDKPGGDADNVVVVRRGVYEGGVCDKGVYQAGTDGLVHTIYNENGHDAARVFFDRTQRLICDWLMQYGFSVGISDLVVDRGTLDAIATTIEEMEAQVHETIRQVHAGRFENLSTKNDADHFEETVHTKLNQAVNKIGKMARQKAAGTKNRMLDMINSGAKGNLVNFGQMIGCLGQQSIDAKRIAYGFEHRTLPHYAKYDDSPEARGFVRSSFIGGLTPQEFFFHAMGGREGLIDTAVKTSESGYLQRKLVKAMEDCKVCHDYTVRDTTGSIVQFLFGEDGVDPIRREKQRLPYVEQSAAEMLATHCWREPEALRPYLTAAAWDALQARPGPSWQDRVFDHYRRLREDRAFLITKVFRGRRETTVSYPIAFRRLVEDAAAVYRAHGAAGQPADLDPAYVLDAVEALCGELVVSPASPGNRLLQALLRLHLSPKPLITRARLDRFAFDKVVAEVRARFLESLANPGEMVGVVAAQSIAEPCTQLSCCRFSELIVQRPDGSMYKGAIGDLVDELLEARAGEVVHLGGDSTVLDVPEEAPYRIVGVSDREKTSWRRISQVSRHPANGGMVRVHTRSGKSTCATLSHSFLKRTEAGIAPVLGSELKVGDRVPVAKFIPLPPSGTTTSIDLGDGTVMALDRDFGWLCGAYLADGWVTGNVINISKKIPEYYERIRAFAVARGSGFHQSVHTNGGIKNYFTHRALSEFLAREFGCGSFNKRVPAWAFNADRAFVAGLLGGYVDGDGNVHDIIGKQMIRTASVSKQLSQDVVLLLAYFGIYASISVNRKTQTLKNGQKQADQYCPQISRKYAAAFKEHIGLVVKHKAASLDAIIAYVQREGAHDQKEEIDKIPELGAAIAAVGAALRYPQQSRIFGRWAKKESIGRRTLEEYVGRFEATVEALQTCGDLEAVLRDPVASEEARKAAVTELDARLGYLPNADDQHGARRIKQYCANLERARAALPLAREKLAVLRQAAEGDVVWDEIVRLEYLDDPKEYVYDFTVPGNDSFMVDAGVLVHNTLNSVHHDTELLLLRNGALERVAIGPFVDAAMEASPEADIERHPSHGRRVADGEPVPKDTLLAWLREDDVKVLSCDERGRIDWQKVEAVTRHPVVNEDGSDTLLKVTTHSGREVIATKAKSFLKRVDNRIQPVNGADLRVGDYLPVSTVLPTRDVAPIEELDVSVVLPKAEFLFMSEVRKALDLRQQVGRRWTKEFGKDIVTPYNRADSLVAAFVGQPTRPATNTFMRERCVYPLKTMGAAMVSHLPERIPLNREFGWLVGAYLAEGCIAVGAARKDGDAKPYAVLICNMSAEFRDGVDAFCKRYDIGYHVDEGTRTMKSGYAATTVSLRMHSLVLGELFMRLFGNGADKKRLHPSLFGAPDDFLHGVVDGYFSGDGSVSKKDARVSAYSASHGLLEDVRQVLVRYGIGAYIRQISEEAYQRNVARYNTTVRGWTLSMSAVDTEKFSRTFTLCLARKQELLAAKSTRLTYALNDTVPDIATRQWGTVTVNRARVAELLAQADHEEDAAVLRAVLEEEQVYYDRVVSIEELPNSKPWVYDLTVENTRNFNLMSGLAARDTFHYSGYSGASTAVRGVPRFKELLHVSKNLKTPIMTVYVLPEYAQDKGKCKDIMNSIQTTYLRDLVSASRVLYDPDDTALAEDRPFVEVYEEWRRQHPGMCAKASDSPWVLRLEFDRSKLLDTGVTLLDVERVLGDYYEDGVSCVFSDDNAAELVGRLRIVDHDDKLDDMLSELKALQQALLESVPIKGIDRVTKASMYKRDTDDLGDIGKPSNPGASVYDEVQGTFERGFEWVISTAGTNLRELLAHGCVDATRTVSNDVVEICAVLGIEAARQALHDEIMAVLVDAFVNYCHVSLLIDTMTHKGYLSSINRHGINRNDIGPLAKSSFEQTTDILVKAGVFADHDRVLGVSANVMLGQVPRFGTGDSEIMVDGEAMAEHASAPPGPGPGPSAAAAAAAAAAAVVATPDMFAMDMPDAA